MNVECAEEKIKALGCRELGKTANRLFPACAL